MRFRFRVLKPLNIKKEEHSIDVDGRTVDLKARSPGIPISESQWLVANCRGFTAPSEATDFAAKLKAAVEISSVATRLGVDTGIDTATSRFAQSVKDKAREEHGLIFRDDVHGIDVFPDNPNLRFPFMSGTATVMASPDPFLSDLSGLMAAVSGSSKTTKDVVLLLNYALMRPEPIAQIVFAFSAVEMLGQQEKWSADQQALLEKLANDAQERGIGTPEERSEVADAIRRGTHRVGLRQGVLRLLNSLGMAHLKPKWDELYSERSTLVHGLAPEPGARYDELANRSVSLCGHILLRVIAREVPAAERYADKFYKI